MAGGPDVGAEGMASKIRKDCLAEIRDAQVSIFGAPQIDGLGTTGGFKLIVEDRGNLGLDELQRVTDKIVDEANNTPGLQGVFGSVRSNTPWLNLDIDREKCLALGVSPSDVFQTLQIYLGSYYVNNFNRFGRSWQVNIMADAKYRANVSQILQLKVANLKKEMIPLATLIHLNDEAGPQSLMRYNM